MSLSHLIGLTDDNLVVVEGRCSCTDSPIPECCGGATVAMSLYAELFHLCSGSSRAAWRRSWFVASGETHFEMQSLGRRGL